jgi:hypothetical protein
MTITAGSERVAEPDPAAVGARADEILTAVRRDDDYGRLERAAGLFAGSWVSFTGFPLVAGLDLTADTAPLVAEAIKVLALKAAVFELTDGDEAAAELVVPAPVDEMVHAVLAQHTLVVQLQHRIGVAFVHMSDRKRFWWEPGDYTERCYRAAGWGDPPARYWIAAEAAAERTAHLDNLYRCIGIGGAGRHHTMTYPAATYLAADGPVAEDKRVEALRAELLAMTEPSLAAELDALPEGDPRRPTAEALAERHGVTLETFYEIVDDVISATLPLRHSTVYQKWCAREGLRP